MRFIKGLIIGSAISAGIIMMYNETDMMNKKYFMKKGKRIAKKMGIM